MTNAGSLIRIAGQTLAVFLLGDALKELTSFQMVRNLGTLKAKPKFLFPEGGFHSLKGFHSVTPSVSMVTGPIALSQTRERLFA